MEATYAPSAAAGVGGVGKNCRRRRAASNAMPLLPSPITHRSSLALYSLHLWPMCLSMTEPSWTDGLENSPSRLIPAHRHPPQSDIRVLANPSHGHDRIRQDEASTPSFSVVFVRPEDLGFDLAWTFGLSRDLRAAGSSVAFVHGRCRVRSQSLGLLSLSLFEQLGMWKRLFRMKHWVFAVLADHRRAAVFASSRLSQRLSPSTL